MKSSLYEGMRGVWTKLVSVLFFSDFWFARWLNESRESLSLPFPFVSIKINVLSYFCNLKSKIGTWSNIVQFHLLMKVYEYFVLKSLEIHIHCAFSNLSWALQNRSFLFRTVTRFSIVINHFTTFCRPRMNSNDISNLWNQVIPKVKSSNSKGECIFFFN